MICRIHSFLSSITLILLTALINPCHAFEANDIDSFLYTEPEKTISMDFTNAKINDVLKMFSQQSGLNFIVAANVASTTVNIYMENVSVEEALERILSANNLTYEITPGSNIFVVKELKVSPVELMTRIYPLKFATVPSSKLNTTITDSQEGTTDSDDEDEIGILAAIEAVLTDDGAAIEDARTNSISITDIPSQFPLIEQTVTRLDVRVPQILIEAELLDISQNTADKLGAKFGQTPLTFAGSSRNTLLPFDQNKLIRDPDVAFTKTYTPGTLSFAGLTVALDFLRTQTDTKNLARPRILTLNNTTAEIAITTDEAIGLASTTTSTDSGSEAVAEAERVETGVFLKVTPQVNIHTREIKMAIEPKVIQARTSTFIGPDGETFKDPEERGTKSFLRVRDGDTIVLGGLLRTDLDNIKTTVPILGNIPLLGAAFRHKDKSETRRELIIFLTPHILEEDVSLKSASSKKHKIVREQSMSSRRDQAIEKDLSFMERK